MLAADRAAAGDPPRPPNPGDDRHRRFGPAAGKTAAPAGAPPIRPGRPVRLGAALSRSLAAGHGAVGRIRAVAQFGPGDIRPRDTDDAGQRPAVGTLVPALAALAGADRPGARRVRAMSGAGCRAGGAAAPARRARGRGGRRPEGGAAPLPVDRVQLRRLRGQIGLRPLWLAASTHDGEEAVAAGVHSRLAGRHPGLLTVIAPRHPARGGAIEGMLAAAGWRVARRSRGDAD